jgi:hypothetical protein
LARLGIDAIIVSGDFNLQPQPAEEWQLVHSSAEGSVYHRGAAPLPIARGYWDAELTQPNTSTSLRVVEHSRNRVVVDYNGDAGDELPVFVAFSRPYFAGYIATGDRRRLDVTSYRGLIPVVELPPGFTGRLTLSYRPTWLVAGGIAAAISVAVVLLGFTRALGEPSKRRACSASLP